MRLTHWFAALKTQFAPARSRKPRQQVRRQRAYEPPCLFEQLEGRILLTNDLFIITHGLQLDSELPNWVYDMATAISVREGDPCPISEIQASRRGFGETDHAGGCDEFLLFDWANESNMSTRYSDEMPSWAEAAGESLFDLVNQRLIAANGPLDLHFIGHSRGAVVVSEAIKRLDQHQELDSKIGFIQMTTLDPHPVGTFELEHGQFDFVDPIPVVSHNVNFADNYFQSHLLSRGIEGTSLDGALNVDLTSVLDGWNGRPISDGGNHAEVHDWYHWTIDLSNSQGSTPYADPALGRQRILLNRDRPLLYDEVVAGRADVAVTKTYSEAENIGFRWSLAPTFPNMADGFAYPDTFDQAAVVDLSSGSLSKSSQIETNGDSDLFKFTATSSGHLTITQRAAAGSSLESRLVLYDGARNEIQFANAASGGGSVTIAKDVIKDQTYYVRAGTYWSLDVAERTGAYTLEFSGVDDEQPDRVEQVVHKRAYVANLRSDFVSVIDTTTNAVVRQIPVGFGQVGIDVSPDGMRAYATLMDSSDVAADHPWGRVSDVAVIDTVAGSVLTTIHTAAPYIADVTVSPRGDIVLLTDHFNNVVRVLSTANNSIVASIPVGSAPDQVAFSPDGRLAYVSNILSWTVSVIDTATLTVVATIGGVGAGANTVCVSPDGSRVYVGSHWNGVSVIDTSSNTVIANLPLNSPNGPVVAMALTPDGTKLYVTDRHHSSQTPNNVWVVNTATNSVEARMTVDAVFDVGLVVSLDGAVVYVSDATSNTVLAIDTATNQIITAISVGQVPHSIATGTISIPVVAPTPPSSAAPVITISGLEPDGIATDEDVPTNEILLQFGDADTPADNLTVTVQSSNPELIREDGIVLSGSGATRTLVLTPAANQYGFATIVVSVSDGQQTTDSTFELTVRAINDVPTATELPELTIEEDTAFDGFEFGVGDVETATEDLVVTATSLTPWLIATADIVVSGSGADRHISFRPMLNAFGEGDVLVDVSDGTDSQQVIMHITVLPVNDLPTISAIDDQITDEDVATSPISFTIGDLETDADNLSITLVSSDPSLISEDSIVIEGSGAERSLILTPAANQHGSATITVLISDGEATVTREFVLTVNPVNDAPTLSPIVNQTIEMEITSPSIPLAIGDVDNDAESLTLQAHSSNPMLVPNANIHFGGHGEQRSLTFTPAANQYGSATITVTLSDGETEVSETFTLTVLHSHLKLTLTGSQSLQLSAGADGRVIALINGAANSTAKTFRASDLRMLTITGGTGANRIDLSAVQPAKFVNLNRVNVDGGAGNDTLIGSGVCDSLLGGAGNDSLLGGDGNDLLDGQAGLDTLTGGTGDDTLDGGAGVDLLVESTDVNVVLTSSQMIGLGTDAVRNLESAKLTGGANANRFDAAGFTGTVTLIGNAGNDTLIGGSANDLLQGGDGADSIQGNAGNDIIDGGTGHDTLLGGAGNDTLTGGTGDDALAGGLGNDKLSGDLGNDTLLGAAGNDSLQGGLGNDVLIGGTGNDTLVGQGGRDTLAGAGYGRARDTGDRLTTDSLDRIDESFAITFAWADLV